MIKRGLSTLVKKDVIKKMIEGNLEECIFNGFVFSTTKVDGAIPTGQKTTSGKEIYIHP